MGGFREPSFDNLEARAAKDKSVAADLSGDVKRGSFYITRVGQSINIGRIRKNGEEFRVGNKLPQYFEPLISESC